MLCLDLHCMQKFRNLPFSFSKQWETNSTFSGIQSATNVECGRRYSNILHSVHENGLLTTFYECQRLLYGLPTSTLGCRGQCLNYQFPFWIVRVHFGCSQSSPDPFLQLEQLFFSSTICFPI